jgi:predicted dehydrogenase
MHLSQREGRSGDRPLRVGIIGTGFGSRVVAGAFRRSGCEVVDVVSARDSTSVNALCRSDVDLVAVHSPPFLHADHVARALDAGRAVLCDKPFGTSIDESVAMTEAAEAAGVVNFLNFEFRCQPARLAMRDLLESGAIGQPEHLAYTAFTSGSRVPLRPWGWLFDRTRGGGWIGAFGSHAIDLIRWLLGDVTRAGAAAWINVTERPDPDGNIHRCDAEDSFAGWVELQSGATASVDSSFTAGVSLTPRIVVTGSEGAIENVGDVRVVLHRKDGTTEHLEFKPFGGDPHNEAMSAWTAAIRDAVMSGQQIAPSFVDGLACMRVMEQWRAIPPQWGTVTARSSPEGRVAESRA